MLKKSERLSRPAFATFFKKGRRVNNELYTLVFTPHPTFHASVVVGKKVAKRAVERNMYRRRIYATLYSAKTEIEGVCVVVTKPPLSTTPRKDAHKQLTDLIGRITKPA